MSCVGPCQKDLSSPATPHFLEAQARGEAPPWPEASPGGGPDVAASAGRWGELPGADSSPSPEGSFPPPSALSCPPVATSLPL